MGVQPTSLGPAAAVLLAALLAAAMPRAALAQGNNITQVPTACVKVHIDDYVKDMPIVMNNGSNQSNFCPDDALKCPSGCQHAVQRLGWDCAVFLRGGVWMQTLLSTCGIHPDDVNPCSAKGVAPETQTQYGPYLQTCPVQDGSTCTCSNDTNCQMALYSLGRRCAKYLGFVFAFTPTDAQWTNLYTRCGIAIGGFENANQTVPCALTSSDLTTGIAVGAIVGIVAGVVVALAAVGAAFFFYRKKRKREKREASAAAKQDGPDGFAAAAKGADMSWQTGSGGSDGTWDVEAPHSKGGTAALSTGIRPSPFASTADTQRPATPPTGGEAGSGAQMASGRAATGSQDPLMLYLKALQAKSSTLGTGGVTLSGGTVASGQSGATASSAPSRTGVDVKPWELRFREIQILEEVGSGSYGKVFRAVWHESEVACKVLVGFVHSSASESGGSGSMDAQRALSIPAHILLKLEEEASMLASLRHPNVVSFYGLVRQPPCIITEFCARGSLADILARARQDPASPTAAALTWPRRLGMALDAAKGMLFLHNRSTPILHRDLKSPNLLVDAHWIAKISDFNLSRLMEGEGGEQTSSSAVMNPRWLAPEVMTGGHSTKEADVFSFAVILHELLTWQLPFSHLRTANNWQLASLIIGGMRLEVPPRERLPGADTPAFTGLEEYCNLMRDCWSRDPSARPNFQHIVQELRSLLERACLECAPAAASDARSPPAVEAAPASQ